MKRFPFVGDPARRAAVRFVKATTGLIAAFIVAAWGLMLPASAQINTASLSVHVSGPDDDPLPGVTVEVLNAETGLGRNAITDDRGNALMVALPPGPYEVAARLEGMEIPRAETTTLRVGQRARLELILGSRVTEEITVTGEKPLVDFYRMDSSTNIVPEQIESLPARDRQYEQLAFLTPGVQRDRARFFNRIGAPVIGGSGHGAATAFIVDGLDLTDNFSGMARVRVSQDAIEEFRVIAHRFDAEIGSSAGAAISVVTKSGTNLLHGSALAAHRSDTLRSKGALETNDVDFSRTHVSATLGGPIVEDQTHYFVSIESIDQNDAAFFRPGGAFTHLAEDVPHPIDQQLALLSLDHELGPSSHGLAKLVYERYREDNYDVGGVRAQSQGWSFNRNNWNVLLGHTQLFGSRRLNELRVQFGVADAALPLNSEEMMESFSRGATLQIGRANAGEMRLDRSHLTLRDSLHVMPVDRHQLKVGLSYFHNRQRYIQDVYDAGEIEYQTDDRTLPFLYTYGVGSSRCALRTHDVGLFAQDDWVVNETLTLSLGLRWDVEIGANNPDFEHPLLPDRRGTDWNNLQPRLGFTWDPTGNGSGIVRGGAGLFSGRVLIWPSTLELGLHGESSRSIRFRINGALLGLGPESWLSLEDPENTGIPFPPYIFLLGDSFDTPLATQLTLGYGRRLGRSRLHLDIEGIYIEGRDEHLGRNANWAGNDSAQQVVNPDYSVVWQFTDENHSRYKALVLGLNGTLRRGHLLAGSLTVADKKNLQDDHNFGERPSDSGHLGDEWGRSQTDERYRLVLSGIFQLPWSLSLGGSFEYGSGQPWNRIYGYDANGDLTAGDRPPGVPRNGEDGPPFRQLNLRLTKGFALGGGKNLDVFLEAFNALDTVNYDVSSVDSAMFLRESVPNPRFGEYTATHPPRQIQLGFKFAF